MSYGYASGRKTPTSKSEHSTRSIVLVTVVSLIAAFGIFLRVRSDIEREAADALDPLFVARCEHAGGLTAKTTKGAAVCLGTVARIHSQEDAYRCQTSGGEIGRSTDVFDALDGRVWTYVPARVCLNRHLILPLPDLPDNKIR